MRRAAPRGWLRAPRAPSGSAGSEDASWLDLDGDTKVNVPVARCERADGIDDERTRRDFDGRHEVAGLEDARRRQVTIPGRWRDEDRGLLQRQLEACRVEVRHVQLVLTGG